MRMLRSTLIDVADHPLVADRVTSSAAVRRLVARYVAGESVDEGLQAASELAQLGAALTLDHVGEAVTAMDGAETAFEVYRDVLARADAKGLPAGISVKPTQLGLSLDAERCATMIEDLAKRAGDAGVHVTLDMEDHTFVESTIQLVERAHAAGLTNVGCAIQAYLHRTPEDVRRLAALGASLRLCKGAYAEPEHLAYQRREEVDRAYLDAARYLLAEGPYPRFATHDHRLVAAIKRHAAELGRDRDSYEFQMLYGVRPEMQQSLIDDGYRLCVYLPFGTQWYPYFTRRLAERPANVLFFLRSLVGGGS
jgi:proline dehydrogenase